MSDTPNLRGLLRETRRLQRDLSNLVVKYPEDNIDSDTRIFSRILTLEWRYLHGDLYGPHERRYWEAADWVDRFSTYIRSLKEYCLYVLEAPERFANLPLNGNQRIGAPESIRLLGVQREVLKRWQREGRNQNVQPREPDVEKVRSTLAAFVRTKGVKAVAGEISCSADTLRDFIAGRTKPQEKMMQRFRRYWQANKPWP